METGILRHRRQITDEEGERIELQYSLTEDPLLVGHLRVVSYGIQIGSRRGDRLEYERVSDISIDRAKIEWLCRLLYEMEVTPITLRDIVQDYIEN